ncbi:MAG TPA: PKD domain-containing protein, partial [Bacteroidales bacterium]|nr:PKD domain-containing protein [Bacteroidales bacterium]
MKKHIIYFLMLLPAVFIASGCQKYETGNPPASTVANFTFSTSNSGKAPCVVTFTNTSLNAAGYLWDFGNGQTSTEANPTATYNTPGFYTVKLTCTAVNDVYYNQLVKTAVINVRDPNAGLAQVLYYTTCATAGGAVHMVVLNDDGIAHVQDFATVTLVKPYGITTDTANKKVYVSDYSVNAIYRFDADGTNPLKILDGTIFPALDSPEG